MIYLDSSALLKLLFQEQDSQGLASWLAGRTEPAVTSEVATVEVVRATRRLGPAALPAARTLLGTLDLVPLSRPVMARAADIGAPALRTLAALHLASALAFGAALTVFVAYDARLHAAAAAAGLGPLQPRD